MRGNKQLDEASGLCPSPAVFHSPWFQDDVSTVTGVLLGQERDEKRPVEPGGPAEEETRRSEISFYRTLELL